MVECNYRLWGDDFTEVTPDPRVSASPRLRSHQGQGPAITVSRSGLYLNVAIKRLTTAFYKDRCIQ